MHLVFFFLKTFSIVHRSILSAIKIINIIIITLRRFQKNVHISNIKILYYGKIGVPECIDINPQPPNDANWRFSGLLQFQPFFGHFLLSLQEKTKFIKICTKFRVKETNFLPSRCISLLLRSKPVQRNCLHLFKIFKKQCAF